MSDKPATSNLAFREAYHHGDLGAALLDAALSLLAEGQEPSLRAVARQAGVSTMAPYRHYADKEALLGAVALRGMDRLYKTVLAADEAAPTQGALIAQAVAYVRFASENPVLFRLMFGPSRPQSRNAVCGAAQDVKALMLRRLMAEAPDRFTPERAIGFWSLVHGLTMLLLDGLLDETDDDSLDGLVKRVVATMLASA